MNSTDTETLTKLCNIYGKVFSVKGGHCGIFNECDGKYIKIAGFSYQEKTHTLYYDILNAKYEKISQCSCCFTLENLVPLEGEPIILDQESEVNTMDKKSPKYEFLSSDAKLMDEFGVFNEDGYLNGSNRIVLKAMFNVLREEILRMVKIEKAEMEKKAKASK